MGYEERKLTLVAAGTIAAGDPMYLNNVGKAAAVDTTAANLKRFIGVAVKAATAGQDVVANVGKVSLTAGTTIYPGQSVVLSTATAKQVLPFDGSSHTADQIIGKALTLSTATGTAINVFVW